MDPALTIIVTNIPPNFPAEDLEAYFESEKFSGGGPVETSQLNPRERTAVIVFEDSACKPAFVLKLQDIR